MPFPSIAEPLRSLRRLTSSRLASRSQHSTLPARIADVLSRTWDLGFTAFGGPPVHFQILHARFVDGVGGGEKWVDEQTYQELFAICQALPGPGSTKMIFCLALLHAGFVPALCVFLVWSLPGAIGMYALALGVQQISDTLPMPVYALLSGMNASTVGIIALAAVQLAEKAIQSKLARLLVAGGACAGLCYNALWYFPVLMLIGGLTTVIWDGGLQSKVGQMKRKFRERRRGSSEQVMEENIDSESMVLEEPIRSPDTVYRRTTSTRPSSDHSIQTASPSSLHPPRQQEIPASTDHTIRVRTGVAIVIVFFASFTALLLTRGLLSAPPLTLNLFANMYLAGTIIFGGGPVVIPLLRSYVVDPGWVSSRDFLLGLAIIQAFPGPNFNFAVFLSTLALRTSRFPTVLGAVLGFVGIFLPGVALAVAVQSFWRVLRRKKWVGDLLRGVNATAVGLVFTAVYRLWEIGYLTPMEGGVSLAREPWWVVVATVTYVESAWFGVPPALAIVIGAALGVCWYGAVGR